MGSLHLPIMCVFVQIAEYWDNNFVEHRLISSILCPFPLVLLVQVVVPSTTPPAEKTLPDQKEVQAAK